MDDVALTNQLCTLLGAVVGWQWHPDGSGYADGVVGVYYGAISKTPDQGVGVRVYGHDDNDQEFLHSRRVQLRFRGAQREPSGADALAFIAFTALQGLSRVGGISGISRTSVSPPLGADSNGRESRTDNYIITLDNSEASS